MDSAFTQIPSRFQTYELTTGSRALGELCFSRDTMPDGTVCNPAFLPEKTENLLIGKAFIGNGFKAISTANQLIFQPITKEFLQELFQNQNTTSVEANLGISLTSQYFSASFSPYRVQYVSEIHNPNLPVIAIHAAVERRFHFAGGISLKHFSEKLRDFSFGAQFRILHRQYIHKSFQLFEAITEDPKNLVPVQKQFALFLDPSLGWTSRDLPWKLRASIAFTDLGRKWPEEELYPDKTDVALGIGAEPPLKFGRLRLGVDIVKLFRADDLFSRFRFGTSYKFGIMEVMSGFNKNALTAGFQFGFQMLQAGIVYEFIRDDFQGTGPTSKVSTEIAIQL